ncbi:MAG: hypothetical protein ABF991_09525 [Liquorilactobacillus hordei]
MKNEFLNFIRNHNYITLLIVSAIVLSLFPSKLISNIGVTCIFLFLISLIAFVVSIIKKSSNSRFNFKKIMLGVLVILITAIFVDVAKGGASEADKSTREASTSQVKQHSKSSSNKKTKTLAKKASLAKKESLKKAESESKVAAKSESESIAASESASIASSESESTSIAASTAESSSIAASMATSQSIAASMASSSSYASAVSSSAAASKATVAHATSNTGDDLYTGTSGKIIGNSNSHIYHVPGQAGYHMNSANAVYFNTEADAQAAGYRKSLR